MPTNATHTVTREPKHPGYDTLGDANNWGEEFYLLTNGEPIGGTYWCPPGPNIEAGKQWVSYGPAGYSFSHTTREDAEQVQLAAAGITATTPTETVSTPAPELPETKPLPMTWDQALTEAKEKGVSRCSDPALMASFCDGSIQHLAGAVSPQLVWEGAQKKGLSAKELGRLCSTDVMAVSDLMWI